MWKNYLLACRFILFKCDYSVFVTGIFLNILEAANLEWDILKFKILFFFILFQACRRVYQMKQNINYNAQKGWNLYSANGVMCCHTEIINLLGENGQWHSPKVCSCLHTKRLQEYKEGYKETIPKVTKMSELSWS